MNVKELLLHINITEIEILRDFIMDMDINLENMDWWMIIDNLNFLIKEELHH